MLAADKIRYNIEDTGVLTGTLAWMATGRMLGPVAAVVTLP